MGLPVLSSRFPWRWWLCRPCSTPQVGPVHSSLIQLTPESIASGWWSNFSQTGSGFLVCSFDLVPSLQTITRSHHPSPTALALAPFEPLLKRPLGARRGNFTLYIGALFLLPLGACFVTLTVRTQLKGPFYTLNRFSLSLILEAVRTLPPPPSIDLRLIDPHG